jgi:hypothetical protein
MKDREPLQFFLLGIAVAMLVFISLKIAQLL